MIIKVIDRIAVLRNRTNAASSTRLSVTLYPVSARPMQQESFLSRLVHPLLPCFSSKPQLVHITSEKENEQQEPAYVFCTRIIIITITITYRPPWRGWRGKPEPVPTCHLLYSNLSHMSRIAGRRE